MSITIKQIAEMAGVHRSTVDKVLHNRPGVSEPVRSRIQKILDECNFQANPIGKALKMQKRMMKLKVLLLKVDARQFLKKGIEEQLKKYDSFQIQTDYKELPYNGAGDLARGLRTYIQERPDGIIISPINAPEVAEAVNECTQAGIPVITVNTDVKGSGRLCFIGQDGFKAGRVAGRLMGEFLSGRGKVAVFTSDSDDYQSFPFGTREGGFRELIRTSYPEMVMLPSIYTREQTQVIRRQMRKLCEHEPDLAGIFITCGGVKAVGDVLEEYERGDIKLICYESYPEIIELLNKGIVTATLDSEIEEQGKKAVELLMEYLIYDRKPASKHLYAEIKILLKESV